MDRLPMFKKREWFAEKGVKLTVIDESTPLVYVTGMLSPEECQHLISLGRPKLEPSTTVIDNTEAVHGGRSSSSAFVCPNGRLPTDRVMANLIGKCSQMTGYPASHFEGLKIVNYQKGQAYYAHHDYFGAENPAFLEQTGDRLMTFFIYLNTLSLSDGGSTSFPVLGYKVKPRVGDAMFWMNMDFNGRYKLQTFHSGDPILSDVEKWGLNVWIRQKAYPSNSD